MIVSIDTMCGEQIVLFFGQETVVVVETREILLIIFLKRGCYCWRNILKLVCQCYQKIFIYFVILQYIQ